MHMGFCLVQQGMMNFVSKKKGIQRGKEGSSLLDVGLPDTQYDKTPCHRERMDVRRWGVLDLCQDVNRAVMRTDTENFVCGVSASEFAYKVVEITRVCILSRVCGSQLTRQTRIELTVVRLHQRI